MTVAFNDFFRYFNCRYARKLSSSSTSNAPWRRTSNRERVAVENTRKTTNQSSSEAVHSQNGSKEDAKREGRTRNGCCVVVCDDAIATSASAAAKAARRGLDDGCFRKKNTEDGQTLAAVDIEGTTMPHGSPADEPAGPPPIVPATLTTDGAADIPGATVMPLPSIVATNDQQKRKEPNASVASRAAATNAPRMQDDGKTNSPTDSGETDVSAVHASIDSIDTADADAAQALLAAARRIPFSNDGDDDTARRGRKSSSAASSANDDAVAGDKAIDTATKLTENMVYRANEEQANDIDSRKQIGGSNDVANVARRFAVKIGRADSGAGRCDGSSEPASLVGEIAH